MYGMHYTCVLYQFLIQKVVVSTQERSFGIKSMLSHMFIQLRVAEMVHGMHCGSVPTPMLAVFNLVKTVISANMYVMHPTSYVHPF